MSNWASPYERATNCTGTVTQGARALLAYCQETYAGSSSMGIYNCRTVRGGKSSSVHSEGRALDLDPDGTRGANGYATGRRIVADLGRHGARLGIQFVIYNREVWSAASSHGRYYGGVHPHNDHLHIELTWAAAHNLTLATLRSVLGGAAEPEPEEDEVTNEDIAKIADAVYAKITRYGLAGRTKDDIAKRVWLADVHGKPARNRLHDCDVKASQIRNEVAEHAEDVTPPDPPEESDLEPEPAE